MMNQKVPLFIFFCGQSSIAKMSETGGSTSRSRTGLRVRERFSKLVKRPSSASGKSHLNVPELSTRDSSSVLSIKSSRSDGANTAPEDSIETKATLSLTDASTAALPPLDVSTGEVSSAITPMNSHVTQMWHRALEAVMRDEEVKEAAILFDSLLKEHMKQEQASPTTPKSSSEHGPENLKDALSLVDRTLQDATKAQEALDTTLGVFAVVKGLSSFVGTMLSECPPAALAWAGVCACIPIIAAPMEQHQSMTKGLRHIYARAPIYFDLTGNLLQDGAHSSDLSNSIRINIQPLYEGILKYIMLSICSIHRGKFCRFWEAISGQAQWKSLLANIEKAEESSLRNIQTIHGSKLLAVTTHFSERYTRAADREDDRRRNEYLHKLKGMDYQTRLSTTRRRLDGTCQWFRQHPGFRDWLDSDGGLLLVSASAGCGKSVLAKYLIEELLHEEDDSATICYFFFKDSDPQARSCSNARKAILHGILKSNPELIDICMEELPYVHDNISNTELWSVFDKLSRAQGAGRIVCVLDALDECDPSERDDLINGLKDHVVRNQGTTGAKFIVTTRGYPQIVNLFTDFSSNKIHLDGDSDEEKRQIQKEISIVMNHRLNKLETTMPDIGPATLDIIRTGLIENSTEQRTYLWMHLMFDYIRKNRFCTREEWREIFRNPPDTVDRTYEGLLQSVTPQAKKRVSTLLALILAAKRPLTIAELSAAVSCRISTLEKRKIDLDDISDEKEFASWIRWTCGSFVTIHDGKAFLIHQTAKEFLLGTKVEPNPGYWQGSMTNHVIHRYMAESCISFLSLERFQQQEYTENLRRNILELREEAMTPMSDISEDDDLGNEKVFTQDPARSSIIRIRDYPGLNRLFEGYLIEDRLCFRAPFFEEGPLKDLPVEPFMLYSAVHWMDHFRRCQQPFIPDRQVQDVGSNFFDLYLNLFTDKHARRYKVCVEWKQQAWYCILMASKPDEIFSSSLETMGEFRLSLPCSFTVSSLACLFDHKRLLMFSLDAHGADTSFAEAVPPSVGQSNLAPSLPHFAAYGTSPWCLEYLQSRGYDIDLQDAHGQTPLHKAISKNDDTTITFLLDSGASKITQDYANRTPLTLGMTLRCQWTARYLKSVDEAEMRSLLYFSAVSGLPDSIVHSIGLIPKCKSEVEGVRCLENTLNRYHKYAGRVSPIRRLFKAGADLEYRFDDGFTALHLSVQDERRIHNTICLGKYSSVFVTDNRGNTPLHTAASADNAHAIIILHMRKADVNCKGDNGETPLHIACKMRHKKAIAALMYLGADLHIPNCDGITALELDSGELGLATFADRGPCQDSDTL